MSNSSDEPLTLEQKIYKNSLATAIVVIAAGGILFLSVLIIWNVDFTAQKEIFSIIVPVFSTWVGTILAYYFAKENFEAANKSVRELVATVTPEQAHAQEAVSAVMIPKNKIDGITLDADKGEKGVLVRSLMDKAAKGSSRIPIFDPSGAIKYVLHESTINRYIVLGAVLSASASAAGDAPPDVPVPGAVGDMTLDDLLSRKIPVKATPTDLRTIAGRFAVVGSAATVGMARDRMLAVDGAQDVFVTKTGKASEPVEGWLTNVDIMRDVTLS